MSVSLFRIEEYPQEFHGLMNKVNKLSNFEKLEGDNFARDIEIGCNGEGNDKVYFKQPTCSKWAYIRQAYARQDQLAYMISHRLGLNVTPATMACHGYKKTLNNLPAIVQPHLYNGWDETSKGVVLQEGITPHTDQSLKLNIQALDIDQLSRAVIFNIVAGRCDGNVNNTLLDQSLKLMEFDNENVGNNKTNSWLFSSFENCVLSKDILDEFLKKEIDVIAGIFKDLEHHFSITLYWNMDTCKNDIKDLSEENVKSNFTNLQMEIKALRAKQTDIKIADLKSRFFINRMLPGYFNPITFKY